MVAGTASFQLLGSNLDFCEIDMARARYAMEKIDIDGTTRRERERSFAVIAVLEMGLSCFKISKGGISR